MTHRSFPNGIKIFEVPEGLEVHQWNEAYVANKWQLTPPVQELIDTSFKCGMRWMIRNGHPQAHARLPNRTGRAYLAFSPSRENQWSFAIDTFRTASGNFGHCVFNGKYHDQFLRRGIGFSFEKRNKTSGHLCVPRDQVLGVIQELSSFDHSVIYLGRDPQGDNFRTEYDIQRAIIKNWNFLPFKKWELVGDEVPIDRGLNSRRLDLLAFDPVSNCHFVFELKRAEAPLSTLKQLQSYLETMSQDSRFNSVPSVGIVVAERITEEFADEARDRNFLAFEINYPFGISQIV